MTTPLVLRWNDGDGRRHERRIDHACVLGRGEAADLRLEHPEASRVHARLVPEGDGWRIEDCGSLNGTFVDGRAATEARLLARSGTVRLGRSGPLLDYRRVERVPAYVEDDALTVILRARSGASLGSSLVTTTAPPDDDALAARYLGAADPEEMGPRTRFIRASLRSAREDHAHRLGTERRRRRRLLAGLVGLLLVVLGVVGGGGWLLTRQLDASRTLALELFYDMKRMELDVLRTQEDLARLAADAEAAAELREHLAQLRSMRERYRSMVEKTRVLPFLTSDEDLLIDRVAGIFGEAEIAIPDAFRREVKAHIRRWQSTERFARAIERASDRGYTPMIVGALEDKGLPRQFFYLALQESDFMSDAVGPPTRFGYAKGTWQFIPATGREYGLDLGPWSDEAVFDPLDERHDIARATDAASRFLADLYRTDAHASGLLVMASYNWGPGNILRHIQEMPADPSERNFWALIRDHEIPDETYNYVFSVFAAAVIGENPRAFGFDFDNPLDFANAGT